MMREIEGVTAEPQARRRWFHDDYFDLFVWQDAGGEVTVFQLCYGIESSDRALVWDKSRGFFHDGTETGAPGSGEIIGTGPVSGDPVLTRLVTAARSLPNDIRDPVIERVRSYVEKKPEARARRKRFRREAWQQKPTARRARSGKASKPKHR